MKIDNEALMFFHSELNKTFFDGQLETAIVCMCPGVDYNEEGIEATTETELDPFIIWFRRDIAEDDPIYIMTVLLHEMVHQYCREHEIEDVGGSWGSEYEPGEHTPEFFEEAEKHGLINGYQLSDNTKDTIVKMINRYSDMRDYKEMMVKDEIETAKENGYYYEV